MPRRYAGDLLQEFQLEAALREGETCDVFVSHKKDDEKLALSVAHCIKVYGLTPWIDVLDDSIQGDGPELDAKIQDIIANSFSLMAVVTEVTHESWWVPFEIGIAFDQERSLASYIETFEGQLPTFLDKHPKVRKHSPDLHNWCRVIKAFKTKLQGSRGAVYLAESMRQSDTWSRTWASAKMSYVEEMSRLTRVFR